MLGHELRNPLAPIRVAAELLARGRLEETQLQQTSAIIARQVSHMTDLVDDLLDVSRVTRGLVSLEAAPQDLRAVVNSAAEQVRPLLERQGHHLTLDLPPEPAVVSGDLKRLVQVVSNLLNNAAKYTRPGGRIRIVIVNVDAEVQVRVEDDGIGIALDLQPHIFDPFTQAERSPDRSQGGLGLGLTLVKGLVELHRGTVSVHSDGLGAGSCFTIVLPRLPDELVDGEGPTSHEILNSMGGLDVLVVDDQVDSAEMLKLLLDSWGHHVRVEHNPFRALEAARQQAPDVGLIDIGLPSMDGYELVRRLRSSPTTAQGFYIAVTGYGQESDRGRALTAGFDAYLVKPADPNRLLALLEDVRKGKGLAD